MNVSGHPSVWVALGAGLLTGLSPCVYPMIPITLAIFGVKAGTPRARALALASAYVAGIAVTFGVLGTVCGLTGSKFGAYLGSPWVVWPLALFFAAMGLSMFGAFEVALPAGLQSRLSRVGGRGFGGAFLMGLVGGIIAAPCTGPPLLSLLAYVTTTRDGLWGFITLATYGVGVGLPLWLLAAFSASMPKPGAWMDWIKSFFGILLLLAALYYLKNVVPALAHFGSPSPRFVIAMAAMIVGGLALGAIHASFYGGVGEKLRKGLGVGLVTIGLLGSINYLFLPKGDVKLAWLTDETVALADARAAGRPVLMDFGADWCTPCKELDVKVFSKPQVAEVMNRFTLLRVDVTNENDVPALSEMRRRYDAQTLPAVRVVSPDGKLIAKVIDGDVPHPDRFREKLVAALPAN
ncbi:MAG TPA: cytochrome c biogenesis protein CcdA [Polyangia bacterium]